MNDKQAHKEPAALVLPFGKHKGATVAEVLAKDPGYAEWLTAQGWLAERFADLHAAIATRGAGVDDTPEHNAMQVKFLDPFYRMACIFAARPHKKAETAHNRERKWHAEDELKKYESLTSKLSQAEKDLLNVKRRPKSSQDIGECAEFLYDKKYKENPDNYEAELCKKIYGLTNQAAEAYRKYKSKWDEEMKFVSCVRFEHKGVDVIVQYEGFHAAKPDYEHYEHGGAVRVGIELKPSMGDDFPGVMRQMQRSGTTILVVGSYSGRAVSEPQLRAMFQANGCTLLFERDIEAELPDARRLCWGDT